MGRTAGLALDDYIQTTQAGIETPVFNRSVLNPFVRYRMVGDGQTTDSSVPPTQWKIQWKNKIYSLMRPVKVSFIGLFNKSIHLYCKNYFLHLTP